MSDNDLIWRGDVLAAVQEWTYCCDAEAAINALPAAQPTVNPLRYTEPEGKTLDQMRDHARQHPLAQAGDMRLVWVNEGDLHMHTIFHAVHPTVSPDVAALEKILRERGAVFDAMVDAAEDAAGKDVSFNVVIGRALRAALAEIKGESHE